MSAATSASLVVSGQCSVWPAHKRVCGRSPIALPLLTPEEAAETEAYMHKPIACLDITGTRKSISQAFQAVAGDTRSPENHPAALAYRAANDMLTQQILLIITRRFHAYHFYAAHPDAEAPPTYDGIGSFDWNLLMPFLEGVEGAQGSDPNKAFPPALWLLRHKLITLFELHWVAHKTDRPACYSPSQMWHAYQDVLQSLDNDAVWLSDATIAAFIRNRFDLAISPRSAPLPGWDCLPPAGGQFPEGRDFTGLRPVVSVFRKASV
ncbi:hypothetical protein JCM10296v2_004052 [Rhodotorula toruloides]